MTKYYVLIIIDYATPAEHYL